jgi:hypothetical protein
MGEESLIEMPLIDDVINRWTTVLSFWTLSIIYVLKSATFRKLDLSPSSGEKLGDSYFIVAL